MLLEFFRHGRKGHTFWKIGQWINKASLLNLLVEERAALTKLAGTCLHPILAWNCLVVRMNCTQGCLAEVLWQRIIWLSEIFLTMCKLAVLCQRALTVFEVMFAQLSFIFLFQGVELTLVAIEVVVVGLLSQVSHDLSGWIIEISWPSIGIKTLTFVARFFARRVVELLLVWILLALLARVICALVQVNLLTSLRSLRI